MVVEVLFCCIGSGRRVLGMSGGLLTVATSVSNNILVNGRRSELVQLVVVHVVRCSTSILLLVLSHGGNGTASCSLQRQYLLLIL